ncbi:UDP-glucose/GDP-mannose dehydrogenase family protein [Arthrobacter agilis]|uniref:UDP-glucose dehydrogenase family protein n=1 Tax=Arthrobacter agilis TaxID=37921 RepID=UPI000B34F6F5|nr:UDP-glucose/GDP-mannose dehydrogenase family protein [Arthrobacter agilis]OUM40499.1 UDP-glucose 6-dehydrogenase [Arthrobacter agilis]PPB45111.1 UDP-glucose/GDP-mannose dehydrogenase family protein [Arthrobacter agilis]TPV27814.1 UDP-glucose/GDP-mannose dehydrogenase family protein [Arthrobacter agilis]VDR31531.1 UDP-glucose 6-dehydrogenase tuaD [Arthrobacter agilis]
MSTSSAAKPAIVHPAPRITVIGTGYLGATHAVCMAIMGFDVLGVDVDLRKIDLLRAGRVPFFEPGLPEKLEEALASGRLRFTTDFDEAAAFGDVHFVCVGTPQAADSSAADLTYVDAAFTALATRIDRKALLVGKSTVPIGTAARLTAMVQSISPLGGELELAWNPEFLREGFAVQDTLFPDRLVFGVSSPWAEQQLRRVFAPILDRATPVIVADLATSELVKVAANSFLATKISFINAMAEICEATGADVNHLAKALSLDDRIGGRFLKPGLGFGGGCLPKDIRAFKYRAEELGVGQAVGFLGEVDSINNRRRVRTVDLIRELTGGSLAGVRVAALGAAFKPNSDDVRDAPALDVARLLYLEGAIVSVYDPEANANAHRAYPDLNYVGSLVEAVEQADVVALLTEWSEFRDADPDALGALVSHRRILDGRHALNSDDYTSKGWQYRALGRPAQATTVELATDIRDEVPTLAV